MIKILITTLALDLAGSLALAFAGYFANIQSNSFYMLGGAITGCFIAIAYTVPAIERLK